MTKADFDYGGILIAEEHEKLRKFCETYTSRESDIKALCTDYLGMHSIDGIDKLCILAFEHSIGKKVIPGTNWGRVVGFSLILHNNYENREDSFLLKLSTLDQLLYLMRTMRFLCYRYNLFRDESALASLNAIFDEFKVPDNIRKMIWDASEVTENG